MIGVVDDVDVGVGGCCTVSSSINGPVGAMSDGVGIATIVVVGGGYGPERPLVHRSTGDLDCRFAALAIVGAARSSRLGHLLRVESAVDDGATLGCCTYVPTTLV